MMVELPAEVKDVDAKLAESEVAYRATLIQRVRLLDSKLVAFDSLLRERNKIVAERERIAELLELYEQSERTNSAPAHPSKESYGVSGVVPGEFSDESQWPVWKACYEILRREDREMFTGELVTRLKTGGRRLREKNPSSMVNASIRDMTDVFYAVKRKGKARWGLVEWKKKDEQDAEE